ncbi:MAG TPA: toll/interleukin-1 receptor domain-containing protein [Pyrinomonadaceae bacterium]|nr:toll/interleukin-1 receptor domain-containing protein [Pyrinomonadaceae bacterium]
MGLPSEWLQFAPKPRGLSDGEKWNVFLSYRSVSRTWVLNLYDVLRELGHKVFIDQCVLKVGDPLIKGLQSALNTRQAGVLIWSSATGDSEWVEREYEVLEKLSMEKPGFQFVPVKLDASKLPAFAERRIFLDFSSYPDGPNGGELLRLLHAIVGAPPRDHYAEAFEAAQDDYYTGINAAAKSVFLGTDEDLRRAASYAERVQAIVGTSAHREDYWKTATAAEALLIQKRYEEAARLYETAVSAARSETGSHKTTWKQACRLMEKLHPTAEERALIRKPFEHLPDCDYI